MSTELENSIREIVDNRVTALYDEGFKSITVALNDLQSRIERLDDETPTSEQISKRFSLIEKDIEKIKKKVEIIEEKELEQLVAKTLLKLMPEFKTKISNEIKEHLVLLAEFVIKNFKEKE